MLFEKIYKYKGRNQVISQANDCGQNYLSESIAIYDAEMISSLINAILRHTNNNTINKVSADEVRNIMNQLKAVGVSIP